MKKEIKTIKIPKCKKCKKLMEMNFTTEQPEDSKKKPKILMCYGTCHKCKVILMCDIIKIKDLPNNLKEFEETMKRSSSTGSAKEKKQ